jgi:outer membrane protein assembly factor BamB
MTSDPYDSAYSSAALEVLTEHAVTIPEIGICDGRLAQSSTYRNLVVLERNGRTMWRFGSSSSSRAMRAPSSVATWTSASDLCPSCPTRYCWLEI